MKIISKYIFLLISFCFSTTLVAQDIPQSEKDALRALYDATNGDAWTNTVQNKGKWDFNTPVTSWNATTQTGWWGIAVQNGHIVTLKLSYNNLSGNIPQKIEGLKEMYLLEMTGNSLLTGPIPSTIGNLPKLTNIYLYANGLTGTIPVEITKLKSLKHLLLMSNKLTGEIPSEIGNLQNLIWLNLSSNQLTGNIPNSLGNLINLTVLHLNKNILTGNIPKSFGSLKKVDTFYLDNNKLSGIIPDEILGMTSLGIFAISNNNFEGKIPNFSNINTLKNLFFDKNKFIFNDFINEFPVYKTNITTLFLFSPQAKTDSPKTMLRHAGQSATMEMFEDLRFHSGDTYQWYKNGVAIVGQTNRTLTLSRLTTANTGTYMCRAYHTSNPDMSPLVLEREPITLTVDNASYTCTNFSSSFTTTGVDNQPYRCGTIKVIPQLQNTDKIAEIRWSITNPNGQRTFLSNQIIPNIEISQYGAYQISAFIVDKEGCEMYTGYGFEVIDCAVCDVTIPGEIVLSDTYSCGTRYPNLSFSNPNNVSLSYQWKFYKPDGSLWYTDNMPTPVTNFDLNGNYKVELIIKNNLYSCQTRTLMVTIPVIACKNTCPIPGEIQMTDCGFGERKTSKEEGCDYTCGERTTYFHLSSEQTIYENSTYNWVFKNPNGQVIGTSNSADYQVPFTFTTIGNNKVELTITNADGCPTVFTPIVVPVVSCCTPVIGEIKVYNNTHLRTLKTNN